MPGKQEQFVGEVQSQNRVAIPLAIYELMKLEPGQRVRITIEKV